MVMMAAEVVMNWVKLVMGVIIQGALVTCTSLVILIYANKTLPSQIFNYYTLIIIGSNHNNLQFWHILWLSFLPQLFLIKHDISKLQKKNSHNYFLRNILSTAH